MVISKKSASKIYIQIGYKNMQKPSPWEGTAEKLLKSHIHKSLSVFVLKVERGFFQCLR